MAGLYEVATDLIEASGKKRAAVFLACVGSAAHTLIHVLQVRQNASNNIIESFERHCIGEPSVTYEMYVFHQRVHQPNESIEDFVADLRRLAKSSEFWTSRHGDGCRNKRNCH